MEALNCIVEERGAVTVVRPVGRVDSVTSKPFEEQLLGFIDGGKTKVVVDFSGLDYINSAGLRVLLMAAKKTKSLQGGFCICSLNETIKKVFLVSGFDKILSIQDSVDTGVTFLG